MTLQPGQTLGRYQILEPLGVGGMATVYKAYQPSLEREVALKVLRPGFAEDPEFFERFQREARSIARLRHPNIVQIFDFEPLDGRYVLAMEFLEGGTLKDRVSALAADGKRLAKSETARIVGEVAEALGYGHELGIVHRDVKPSNVMLTRRDRAVVTDFGIAKIVGGEGQTQTGVGIGTPEYMAPEQGTGAKVDQRADIYSLGVMAYEMLTGRVPFVADTPLAVVLAHVRDPLPLPSTIDATVDAATERVLLKALAKDPADRYATAPEFADALRAALVPVPATAATVYPVDAAAAAAAAGAAPARGGIPRNLIIGAALIALLLAAGAAYALTRGTSPDAATPSPTLPVATVAGCAFPPCPPPGQGQGGGPPPSPGQGGPGPQANPGSTIALPAKGALLAELKLDPAVARSSGRNTATKTADGALLFEAREPPGLNIPLALPAPGTVQSFVTEVRAARGSGSAQSVYELRLRGNAGQIWIRVNLASGGARVEIMHDATVPGSQPAPPRQLAMSEPIALEAPAHTLLVQRKGTQLAAFIDGKFAASATEPNPAAAPGSTGLGPVQLELAVGPIYGPQGTEPALNSFRLNAWAVYATAP